jgi:hypothetical protein
MSGLLILAIVLANQAILALAAGGAVTQFVTGMVGRFIMQHTKDGATTTSSMDMCNTGFVGKSWARLLNGFKDPELLWHPLAPSVFMATVGYFVGWGFALQQLYKEEIDAKVMPRATLIATGILSLLLLAIAVTFRVASGCETLIGAAGGIGLGLLFGYFGCILLGYATDRRATNIWGIPLLRDRINNGSALYICPKEED